MLRCENSFFGDTSFHFRTNPYSEKTTTFKLLLRFETYLGFEAIYINVNFKNFTHLRITCHDDTDTWQWSILRCHWWEFWSRDTDVFIVISYLLKLKNYKIPLIIGANLSFSGSSGISSFSDWLRICLIWSV